MASPLTAQCLFQKHQFCAHLAISFISRAPLQWYKGTLHSNLLPCSLTCQWWDVKGLQIGQTMALAVLPQNSPWKATSKCQHHGFNSQLGLTYGFPSCYAQREHVLFKMFNMQCHSQSGLRLLCDTVEVVWPPQKCFLLSLKSHEQTKVWLYHKLGNFRIMKLCRENFCVNKFS